MASGEEAAKADGGMADSLGFFGRAAKSDPAKKQPWLRIAQLQFDARSYGEAITAAQEVLQRDNTDITAKSILAASGLRVAANGLQQLRAVDALGGGTRGEAQELARIMRDALGESILPAPAAASAPPVRKPQPIRKAPQETPPPVKANAVTPAAAPAVNKAPPASVKPPEAPEPKRNPFSALKG